MTLESGPVVWNQPRLPLRSLDRSFRNGHRLTRLQSRWGSPLRCKWFGQAGWPSESLSSWQELRALRERTMITIIIYYMLMYFLLS